MQWRLHDLVRVHDDHQRQLWERLHFLQQRQSKVEQPAWEQQLG